MADLSRYLTETSHEKLKRLVNRELNRPPGHLAPLANLISPGDPEIVRLGKAYGGLAAATYDGPTLSVPKKGEGLLHRLKADASGMEDFETEPEVIYNVSPRAIGDGQECVFLRDRSINDSANPDILQPGWIAIPLSPDGNRRHGFGTLSLSGTDFHHTGPGLVNMLADGIESVNSDAGSPVVTFQAMGMNWDRIIVQDTGIWTIHFHAGMQPYPQAAPTPASYENKTMRVLSNGEAIGNGSHFGNTDNICSNEAFIRRSVWVLKGTDFEAPDKDDSILFARFSSMYTCGRRYDHDFDRSFVLYLEEGDELSIWHDVDLDEETSSAYPDNDVPYQMSLQLHYSDEPI